jgi:hypothetical protein
LKLSHNLGSRLLQAKYLDSRFPNDATHTYQQNNVRVSAAIALRVVKREPNRKQSLPQVRRLIHRNVHERELRISFARNVRRSLELQEIHACRFTADGLCDTRWQTRLDFSGGGH